MTVSVSSTGSCVFQSAVTVYSLPTIALTLVAVFSNEVRQSGEAGAKPSSLELGDTSDAI